MHIEGYSLRLRFGHSTATKACEPWEMPAHLNVTKREAMRPMKFFLAGLPMCAIGGALVFAGLRVGPLWFTWIVGPILWYLGLSLTFVGAIMKVLSTVSARKRAPKCVAEILPIRDSSKRLVAQARFTSYFSKLITLKLRARSLPHDVMESLRQEIDGRVLDALNGNHGIQSTEGLGAHVNTACNHVLREYYRHSAPTRHEGLHDRPERPDRMNHLESTLVSDKGKRAVRRVLAELAAKDRELLRALFLEDQDRNEICREFGVDCDYLRVLLQRAKTHFRAAFPNACVALSTHW